MNKTLSLLATFLLVAAAPASAQKAATAPAPAPAPVATPAPGSGASLMRPGLWETTVTNESAGVEGRRTIVSRYCYAAGDVGDLARVLPRQREPGMKCENRDIKAQAAGKATWQVTCSSADASLGGSAEATFAATSYTGKAELERRKKGAKAEKVSSTLSGKWIETCK